MAGALNIIARDFLGFKNAREQLRYEHVQAIRTKLGERYKPATANRYLSAVKGVLRETWRLGEFAGEEIEKVRDVRSVPGSAAPAGRALSKGELKSLMDGCSDGTPVRIRDAAVIALGYGAGLRRTEISGLSLEDIRTEGAGMVVRVVGKGAKERLVYLDNGAMEAIADYIEARGGAPGALLWSARKGGRLNEGAGMSDEEVAVIMRKCAARAGVGKLSPHDLRRSFVSDLLDAGVDIATVAAMAGHSRVTTTQRYDRGGRKQKEKRRETLHVPYSRRRVN
jgi:site-specific recombinase XerD